MRGVPFIRIIAILKSAVKLDGAFFTPGAGPPPLLPGEPHLTNPPPDDKMFLLLKKGAGTLRSGQAAGHVLRKEVRPYADYVTYRSLHGDDYRKKQKPPLWQVTVS